LHSDDDVQISPAVLSGVVHTPPEQNPDAHGKEEVQFCPLSNKSTQTPLSQ